MAVEFAGFETVPAPVEKYAEGEKSVLENGKLNQESAPVEKTAEGEKSTLENGKPDQELNDGKPILLSSHGEEPIKAKDVSAFDIPKNPSDDWPNPGQIYSFYFPKVRQYDDPQIKVKIYQADREISQINHARLQTTDALKAERLKRAELISQLKDLRNDNRQIRSIMDEKMREREPLQHALGKLRDSNGAGLCSSEEELNELIQALQYRIQHESIPLSEEKQLLREIKQLEGMRKDVLAYAAERGKLQESFGPKESIQDQVKLIGGDLQEVREEKQGVQAKIKQLDEVLKQIDREITSLQEDLANITHKREKVFKGIQQLRTQRDCQNAHYYQCRKVLMEARVLATKKDFKALENLVEEEGDKFINLWSSDKAFRDDYVKRILQSLENRRLSRDGRIRNADEKPLVAFEVVSTTTAIESSSKSCVKQPEENSKTTKDSLPVDNVHKEAKNKGRELQSTLKSDDFGEADTFELQMPKQETEAPPIDKEKLKEMKRQEEIAKAKQALERKKKLLEKAAAKAAVRAQKEAEKKLKEHGKKAKKKVGSSATGSISEDTAEATPDAILLEKSIETVEAPVQEKEKVQKENPVRFKGQAKTHKSIPKAILKRKKSNNYWIWGAASLVLVILALFSTYGF